MGIGWATFVGPLPWQLHRLRDPLMIVAGILICVLHVRQYRIWLARRRRGRRCVGCGYDLEKLNMEEDGCRVCPECGAAWKVGGAARGVSGGEGARE